VLFIIILKQILDDDKLYYAYCESVQHGIKFSFTTLPSKPAESFLSQTETKSLQMTGLPCKAVIHNL